MDKIKRLGLFLAGFMACASLALFACTALQGSATADAAKNAAPYVPAPAGTLVAVTADVLKAEIANYMAAHPEQPADKPLPIEAWVGIVVSGLFGGGFRRVATDFIAKNLVKGGTPPA